MAEEDLITNVKVFTGQGIAELSKMLNSVEKLEGGVESLNATTFNHILGQLGQLYAKFTEDNAALVKFANNLSTVESKGDSLFKRYSAVMGGINDRTKMMVATMSAASELIASTKLSGDEVSFRGPEGIAKGLQAAVNAARPLDVLSGSARVMAEQVAFASNEIAMMNGQLNPTAGMMSQAAATAKSLSKEMASASADAEKMVTTMSGNLAMADSRKSFIRDTGGKDAYASMQAIMPKIVQMASQIETAVKLGDVGAVRSLSAEVTKLGGEFENAFSKVKVSISTTEDELKRYRSAIENMVKEHAKSLSQTQAAVNRYGTQELKNLLAQMGEKQKMLDSALKQINNAMTSGNLSSARAANTKALKISAEFTELTKKRQALVEAAKRNATATDAETAAQARYREELAKSSAVLSKVAADVAAGAASFAKFSASLAKSVPVVGNATAAFSKMLGIVAKLVPGLDNLSRSAGNTGQSFFQLRAKLFTAIAIFGMASASISNLFTNMSDAIEGLHRFSVAFRDSINSTIEWNAVTVDTDEQIVSVEKRVETLSDKLQYLADSWDMNVLELRSSISMFKLMGDAMGFSEKASVKLAENMTYMSQDIASLNDMDVATVVSKLQSALAGQTRAIRGFGADITEGTLVQFANDKMGMDIKSIDNLTRLDKAILYNNAIIQQLMDKDQEWAKKAQEAQKSNDNLTASMFQSGNATADWAESMNTPANQLRSLRQQLLTTQQDIGALFIPALQSIIPVLNVIARAASAAASAIASLMGTSLSTLREQFLSLGGKGGSELPMILDDAASGMDDVGGAAGGASSKVKELKKQLMGFDEINNITPETDSSGGGGGGGASGGGSLLSEEDLWRYEATAGADTVADKLFNALKDALAAEGWTGVGKFIGESLNNSLKSVNMPQILRTFETIGRSFAEMLNGVFATDGLAQNLGRTIGDSIDQGIRLAYGFVTAFDFGQFGTFLGDAFRSMWENVNWSKATVSIIAGVNGWFTTVRNAINGAGLSDLGANIGTMLRLSVENIDWSLIGDTLASGLSNAFGFLASMLRNFDFGKFASGISEAINSFLFNTDWAAVGETIILGLSGVAQTITQVIFNLETWAGIAKAIFEALLGALKGVFENPQGFLDLILLITTPFTGLVTTLSRAFPTLAGVIAKVFPKLGELGEKLVVVKDFVKTLPGSFSKAFANVKNAVGDLSRNIANKFNTAYETVTGAWGKVFGFFKNVFDKVGKLAKNLGGLIKNKLIKAYKAVTDKFKGFATIIKTKVVDPAKKALSGIGSAVGHAVKYGFLHAIGGALTLVQNSINGVLGILNNIPGVNISNMTFADDFKARYYAKGGFPNAGQMFVAREAGPELVGTIGGRTAVANNDQIVEAVAAGVAQAVKSVLGNNSSGGKNITISLNLDGRQIIKSINSAQRVAGRTLLEV